MVTKWFEEDTATQGWQSVRLPSPTSSLRLVHTRRQDPHALFFVIFP